LYSYYLEFWLRIQAQFTSIESSPILPENILVTNYSGLQLSTHIALRNFSYNICEWVVDDGDRRQSVEFFYSNFLDLNCINQTSISNEFFLMITCSIGEALLNTSLTIISPLRAGMWNIFVQCIYIIDHSLSQRETFSVNVTG